MNADTIAAAALPTTLGDLRRCSVDEYHRMVDAGFFAHDERFELLEGLVVRRPAATPRQAAHIGHLRGLLESRLPAAWHVRTRSGFTLSRSEPEPDLVVVAGRPRDYLARHPSPGDVALVVQVADVTVARDRELRGGIYAAEGVRLYWMLNVPERVVEVMSSSGEAGALGERASWRRFERGDELAVPLHDRSIRLGVDEIFFA